MCSTRCAGKKLHIWHHLILTVRAALPQVLNQVAREYPLESCDCGKGKRADVYRKPEKQVKQPHVNNKRAISIIYTRTRNSRIVNLILSKIVIVINRP